MMIELEYIRLNILTGVDKTFFSSLHKISAHEKLSAASLKHDRGGIIVIVHNVIGALTFRAPANIQNFGGNAADIKCLSLSKIDDFRASGLCSSQRFAHVCALIFIITGIVFVNIVKRWNIHRSDLVFANDLCRIAGMVIVPVRDQRIELLLFVSVAVEP